MVLICSMGLAYLPTFKTINSMKFMYGNYASPMEHLMGIYRKKPIILGPTPPSSTAVSGSLNRW